ncbi:Uncharacterised protein [Bordetella ansorpii]|uniref:Uncharacterized protein n=1 Tax=Bordetella ansorpii TaxID=288768 RepID=A0A157LTK0_9BORD|nr:hypothetical protein [Bordetella ansorpii]SAH99806.1 Uncharacterised protein [Bordetella ansorpii]
MAVITADTLGYPYAKGATRGDDLKLRGEPDSSLFNRKEIYEVVYLLNRFCAKHNFNRAAALKAERMIQTGLPADVRTQANVVAWLEAHWAKFK